MVVKLRSLSRAEIFVLAEDYAGYNSPFLAQHGICFYIKAYGEKEINLLFDTGTYFDPILFNSKIARINLKEVSIVFLSHCHIDHTGGLANFLSYVAKPLEIVAHPDILREHRVESLDEHVGVPKEVPEVVKRVNAHWRFIKEPEEIVPGIWVTGEIERKTNFEVVEGFYTKVGDELIEDKMLDDISLVLNVGQHTVLITGCSHAGIVNIVKHVEKRIGRNVTEIIGGLHLMNAGEERLLKTIEFLEGLELKNLYCGHCTGFRTECLLSERFKNKFTKLHCGLRVVFKGDRSRS